MASTPQLVARVIRSAARPDFGALMSGGVSSTKQIIGVDFVRSEFQTISFVNYIFKCELMREDMLVMPE